MNTRRSGFLEKASGEIHHCKKIAITLGNPGLPWIFFYVESTIDYFVGFWLIVLGFKTQGIPWITLCQFIETSQENLICTYVFNFLSEYRLWSPKCFSHTYIFIFTLLRLKLVASNETGRCTLWTSHPQPPSPIEESTIEMITYDYSG